MHYHSKYVEQFARVEPLVHIEQLNLNRSLNLIYRKNRHEAMTPLFKDNQPLKLQSVFYVFCAYLIALLLNFAILLIEHSMYNRFSNK